MASFSSSCTRRCGDQEPRGGQEPHGGQKPRGGQKQWSLTPKHCVWCWCHLEVTAQESLVYSRMSFVHLSRCAQPPVPQGKQIDVPETVQLRLMLEP